MMSFSKPMRLSLNLMSRWNRFVRGRPLPSDRAFNPEVGGRLTSQLNDWRRADAERERRIEGFQNRHGGVP